MVREREREREISDYLFVCLTCKSKRNKNKNEMQVLLLYCKSVFWLHDFHNTTEATIITTTTANKNSIKNAFNFNGKVQILSKKKFMKIMKIKWKLN